LNKIAKCFPFLTFLIIPFLGGNHLSLYYVTIDKFWIETSFVILLAISICISSFRSKGIQVGFTKFILFFLPYLLMIVASLFYTWNKFNTLNELNTAAWIVACVYLFSTSEKKDSLLMALVIGASLNVVCMVIQYKIVLPSLAQALKDGKYGFLIREKAVPFSSYLNEATLGGYFLFLIPLSIYWAILQRKLFYVFTSSIIIFGLLFSLSRIGMVLGALSVVVSAAVVCKKRGLRGATHLGLIIFLACTIFLVVVYSGSSQGNSALHSTAIHKIKKIPEHISTLTYRTGTWSKSMEAFLDKPLMGYGAGAFEYAYRKYYDASLYTRYAHNVLVKIVVELGLLGLVCFLFYLSGVTASAKRLINDTRYFFISLSAASGFLFGLFNVTFEIPAYAGTFFILSSTFFYRDQEVGVKKKWANFIFLPIICLLLGSFLFTARADVSQKLYEEGVMYEEQGLSAQAFASYREAIDSMPLNNNGHIGLLTVLTRSCFAAQNVHEKERIKKMIAQYLPRIDSNPDKDSELFLVLGNANSLLGEEKKAERYFIEAMNYHPSSGYYMYETASFYFLHGNTEKAMALIKRMERYADRHSGSDMHGLYVYKMRDLQASIECLGGHTEMALRVARKNLEDAEKEKGIIENVHAREYVTKEAFVNYFRQRVEFYESKSRGSE
jgi:O-antigen ligase